MLPGDARLRSVLIVDDHQPTVLQKSDLYLEDVVCCVNRVVPQVHRHGVTRRLNLI